MRSVLCLGLAVLAASGCGMPAYVRSAYYGDLPTLRRDVESAVAAGRVDRARVVELAEAVARREVRSVRGETAAHRIHEARGCTRAVEAELRERAAAPDDAGAEATLVLFDAGLVDREVVVAEHARSTSGAWRAVAARGTTTPALASLRRAFYLDPDERARREAFRAALEARDPGDRPALLEAMRLDPDAGNRSAAMRAAASVGGAQVAAALRDLWATADPQTGLAVIEAWAAPAVWDHGGFERLLDVAESRRGLPAVSAASALVRGAGRGAPEGRAVLAHFIEEGTTDERLLAIQLAPLDAPDVLANLDDAARSDDAAVAVVADARLLEVPARRAAALGRLRSLAMKRDGAARQARLALAAAGEAGVASGLAKDLAGAGAGARRQIAVGLFRLGKPALMAATLADRDPGVRMTVACSVLAAAASG